MTNSPLLSVALFSALVPSSPCAAVADSTSDEIVITAKRDSYMTPRTASSTRTETDLLKVPQSVGVIDRKQIADQAMHSLTDVLRFVPGVSLNAGEGHRDQIVLRGNNSTADFFIDGLRDDVQYYRGLYNLERVEVLKGPNAMIFGRGGGGGVINRVTKRPEDRPFASAAASRDSRGAWDLSADLNAPLNATLSARLNAVTEHFDSFRAAYHGHREGLNPTLAWRPDGDTRLDLGFEYDHDDRVVDRGIPSAGPGTTSSPARPLRGYESTFFGQRGTNRTGFTGKVATTAFEHRFSPSLRLVARGMTGNYDKYYRNALAATPVTSIAGVPSVGIEAYESSTRRKSVLGSSDLIAEVTTGPIKHTLLAGIDYARERTRAIRFQGFFDSGVATVSDKRRTFVPLADEIAIPPITFRDGIGHTDAFTVATALGVYVQDQARIGKLVTIIAGLRRDRFQLDVDNRLTVQHFARTDTLWSPRLGLVLSPAENLSAYASYSRSFLPQSGDQYSSLDITSASLEPEQFVNHEVGLKWRPLPGLDLAAAAYRLDRTNTRSTDPGTGLAVLTESQRSTGVEFSAQGQISSRFSLTSGATWQSARISSTTTAAPTGRRVALVPRFQSSLWGRYDLGPRLGLGLGAIHQSSSFASISNTVLIPAWTRLDAALFTKVGKHLEIQLNLENLANSHYIGLAASDNNLIPANPRTLRATLRTRL